MDGVLRLQRWEGEAEDRPAPWVGARRYPAFVGLDNGPADRKAEAHAGSFGRHERPKQLRYDFGREPGAGIGDLDLDHSVRPQGRRDQEVADWRVVHRLDAVAHQVE